LPRLVKKLLKRELEIHNHQRQRPYALTEKDRKWIDYLNKGIFYRAFSRVVLLAKVEDRWTDILETSSMLGCSDKTTRKIHSEIRSLEMLETKIVNKKLYFRANHENLELYYRYLRTLHNPLDSNLKSLLSECLEYLRLMDNKTV
tara:strand:+ start:342 stop:776 length:435 start_codon:yes stop_codon:yes gene_type:complete